MPIPTVNGQAIITLAQYNLGGRANSVTPDQLLSFINEGKDEVWSALKQMKENYFITPSQPTDSTQPTYFPALSVATREYTLPADLRDIEFIEVTAPSGYEEVEFRRVSMLHPDFRQARQAASAFHAQGNSSPLTGTGIYYFDVVGKSTFVLAQYPEVPFTLIIWYVKALPDITASSTVDEIIFPFSKHIATYAVMKIRLMKAPDEFAAWKTQWRDELISMTQGSDRNGSDPQFVADFEG